MDAVTQWAEERGVEQVVLGVTETNLSVLKFYEHLGYTDRGFRVHLPGNGTKQIIIMARRLKP